MVEVAQFDANWRGIVASVEAGCSIEDAGRAAGVPVATVRRWLREGRKGKALYVEFAERVDGFVLVGLRLRRRWMVLFPLRRRYCCSRRPPGKALWRRCGSFLRGWILRILRGGGRMPGSSWRRCSPVITELATSCPPRFATARTDRETFGGEVAKLAALLGFQLMDHQRLFLDVALEHEDGALVYREIGWGNPEAKR